MKTKKCFECLAQIESNELNYSVKKFGIPLCRSCQNKLSDSLSKATDETKLLYFALRTKGVPAELEKWDGFKHIDIAITRSKLNIEVDGAHHNTNLKQTLADLRRTYHSFKKGFFTLRIPNTILRDEDAFQEAVTLICEIAEIAGISAKQNQARNTNYAKSKQPNEGQIMSRILSLLDD
jgi:very-short-patch-repair endonuclease